MQMAGDVSRRKNRKKNSRNPGREIPAAGAAVLRVVDGDDAHEFDWRDLVRGNRAGFVGFLLSLGQLVMHASWLGLTMWLQQSGRAAMLTAQSPVSWLVVILLGVGLLLTGAAMFVSLVWGLRKEPRLLALLGFGLSFFCGVLASAIVFMSALRAMNS